MGWALKFKVRCTSCQEKFSSPVWPPKSCPACGHFADPDDDDRICMPSIKTMRTAHIDKTYREMEAASEQRVLQAAEAAGCDPSEMSGLKITDLNDRKDAEIAAKYTPTVIDAQIQHLNQAAVQRGQAPQFGFQRNDFGYEGGTGVGAYPNAGAHARVALQRALPPVANPPEPLQVQQLGYRRRA